MGLFDIFGRDSRAKHTRERIDFDVPAPSEERPSGNPVVVFHPTSYDDVQSIIDTIKSGKMAMVHLTTVKPETAIRVLDMLSGAIYALDGGVYEMQKNIFMFSPHGVEVQ